MSKRSELKETALALYKAGQTLRQVGRACGVSHETVRQFVREEGLSRPRSYRLHAKVSEIHERAKKRKLFAEGARERVADMRAFLIYMYGGKCACCGEKEFLFLELDHKNNDGKLHRALTNDVYRDLIERNFPPVMQVLCANCHSVKSRGYTCPHKLISLD